MYMYNSDALMKHNHFYLYVALGKSDERLQFFLNILLSEE